jgi:hypothetical protein
MKKQKQKTAAPMTVTEKMRTITAEEFGLRIARVFLESKSSTAIFFMQRAFADCDDDNGIFWEAFRDMLTRLEKQ